MTVLYNRWIIGYSVGENKDASLIERAILYRRYSLNNIKAFHLDRGREYDNHKIGDILEIFTIEHSLSRKGNFYDNAVGEVINKILKIEIMY